jgi:hypothetical protein
MALCYSESFCPFDAYSPPSHLCLELPSIKTMASDGFPENSVCFTTTTITSLGTCDENNKDGEIWKMVEVELVVTNSTGDRVAASEDFTHLEVVFPRFQLGSNIRSSVSDDSCYISVIYLMD